MKKNNLALLLLALPFLFSCQSDPHIDAMTEEEAKAFINEHYANTAVVKPKTSSEASWKINKDNDAGDAKMQIINYISTETFTIDQNEGKMNLTEARCEEYVKELSKDEDSHGDVYIAMNNTYYSYLYASSFHSSTRSLSYKNGPDNGLMIMSNKLNPNELDTLTHTYDKDGHESKFERVVQDSELNYTLTITFVY